jgi:hypothetical protein
MPDIVGNTVTAILSSSTTRAVKIKLSFYDPDDVLSSVENGVTQLDTEVTDELDKFVAKYIYVQCS